MNLAINNSDVYYEQLITTEEPIEEKRLVVEKGIRMLPSIKVTPNHMRL